LIAKATKGKEVAKGKQLQKMLKLAGLFKHPKTSKLAAFSTYAKSLTVIAPSPKLP